MQHLYMLQLTVLLCISMSLRVLSEQIVYNDVSVNTLDGVEFTPMVLAMAKFQDLILVTSPSAIWTLDPLAKSLELVAGSRSPLNSSYVDGLGETAPFSAIGGLVVNENTSMVIASDISNHCLLEFNVNNRTAYNKAGVCTSEGFLEGPALQAKFANPTGIIAYQNGIVVADATNSRLRYFNQESGNVSTVVENVINPQYLIEFEGFIYVTITSALMKVDPDNLWSIKLIAGDEYNPGSSDETFLSALFNSPMMPINPTPGLLFVPDMRNNLIRLLNFTSQMVSSICMGSPGYQDGTGSNCTLANPRAMMIFDEQTAYFSQENMIRILTYPSLVPVAVTTSTTAAATTPSTVKSTRDSPSSGSTDAVQGSTRYRWCTTESGVSGIHEGSAFLILLTISTQFWCL